MKKYSLNSQILFAALLAILLGLYAHRAGLQQAWVQHSLQAAGLMGGLFIDMLKMILIPLVFCAISSGIAQLNQHHQAQQVWRFTLIFFITSMLLAIVLGITGMQVFQPGKGLDSHLFADSAQALHAQSFSVSSFASQFLHQLFINPFAAFAQGQILAVVVFAVLLGIALFAGGERYQGLQQLLQQGLEVILRMVSWIMVISPLGIAALLFKLTAQQDMAVLMVLKDFVLVVMAMTLLHATVVLPGLLYFFTGKNIVWFWRGAREALMTAFATSSSAATMPVTLRCVTQQLGVRQEIAGFVIPLGATLNMDGTALYEAAAALFIANLTGLDLSLSQQIVIVLVAMIAAMGAPGLPSAGMVTMVMVLQSVGLPAEAIAILLPVDRLLDTLRTTVNVQGDMVGALLVQHLCQADQAQTP